MAGITIDKTVDLLMKHADLMRRCGSQTVSYELDAFDILVLHAAVCVAAKNPSVTKADSILDAIDRFRGFCKEVWIGQGLSSEEADMRDLLVGKFEDCARKGQIADRIDDLRTGARIVDDEGK